MAKHLLLSIFCLGICWASIAQKHRNRCSIEVKESKPHVLLDKLRYYSVEFYNGSQKTMDALEWEAQFFDKFEKLIGTRKGTWSSGKWVKPIQPGDYLTDREFPEDIGDANKIIIEVSKVHFVGGAACP